MDKASKMHYYRWVGATSTPWRWKRLNTHARHHHPFSLATAAPSPSDVAPPLASRPRFRNRSLTNDPLDPLLAAPRRNAEVERRVGPVPSRLLGSPRRCGGETPCWHRRSSSVGDQTQFRGTGLPNNLSNISNGLVRERLRTVKRAVSSRFRDSFSILERTGMPGKGPWVEPPFTGLPNSIVEPNVLRPCSVARFSPNPYPFSGLQQPRCLVGLPHVLSQLMITAYRRVL